MTAFGVVFNLQVCHALLKADLTAQRDDLFAQILHHLDQFEGANVRMRLCQNLGRGTGLNELIHHLAPQKAWVLDLAVKFAVRECAGTTFTKLHV